MTVSADESVVSCSGDTLRYRLVVFDFDGTLADSFPFFLEVFDVLADAHGFKRLEREHLEALRGYDTRRMMRHVGLPLWKAPRVAMHFKALMGESIGRIRLFDGAEEALGELKRCGVKLAVVSSNASDNVRAVLGSDLARLIDDYDCGVAILGKRSRLRALVKNSGIAREAVLCIGDEVRDIEAAQAEKLDAGAVTWGYATAKALIDARPSFVFSSFAEIVSCVKAS